MVTDIAAYLAQFPPETVERLQTLRRITLEHCPQAEEGMAYGLISYKFHGRPLIYYGGFANHIGVYPTPEGTVEITEELAPYHHGKGSIRFALSDPLPLGLITQIIRSRVATVSEELPPLGKPAISALATIGITKASQLAGYSEKDLLALHGVGPKAIRILKDHQITLGKD